MSWVPSRPHYIPAEGAAGQLYFLLPTSASCLSGALRSHRVLVRETEEWEWGWGGGGRVGVAWGIITVSV